MNQTFLSFEQVKNLLSPQLKITNKIGRGSIYDSVNHSIVAFCNSRDYEGGIWWYSVYVYNLFNYGVSKVCLTLGMHGIVVVPMSLLLEYAKYADYKDYDQGKRFYIRIKQENNKILLYHSSHEDVDLTPMFLSYSLI
ncbi:MAG: hypothetical protein IJ916_00655 [Paludibacteraceae bacterium]|nr:hypothetical protein [Paludibacteraceae bacterium]